MRVARWGNSLAVRLPTTVVEALELKEGEDIEITAVGYKMVGDSKVRVARRSGEVID